MADLAALIRDDYAAHDRRSADRLERSLSHLLAGLGEQTPARIVDEGRVTAYIAARRADGAAVATVNRELAALRRAFRLAMRAGRVERRPDVQALTERNARQGFFEPEQLRAVLRHLPADLQPPVLVAYVTGWRMHSEILSRQWQHVDLDAGWLRLEPGEGKTGEGRQFPLSGELLKVLQRQRKATDALKRKGQIVPWVFHRDGRPIRNLRAAWHTACKEAGVPGRIIHDLRRTAVRNLERAGVPRGVAMRLVGHRTESIYRRYAIVHEADLAEAGKRLVSHFDFTLTSHSARGASQARKGSRKSL